MLLRGPAVWWRWCNGWWRRCRCRRWRDGCARGKAGAPRSSRFIPGRCGFSHSGSGLTTCAVFTYGCRSAWHTLGWAAPLGMGEVQHLVYGRGADTPTDTAIRGAALDTIRTARATRISSEHRIARALQTGEAHEARIHLPTPSQLRKLLRHRLIRMCGKKSPHRVIISRLMLTSKPASWVSAVPVNKGITSKVLTANAGCSLPSESPRSCYRARCSST